LWNASRAAAGAPVALINDDLHEKITLSRVRIVEKYNEILRHAPAIRKSGALFLKTSASRLRRFAGNYLKHGGYESLDRKPSA